VIQLVLFVLQKEIVFFLMLIGIPRPLTTRYVDSCHSLKSALMSVEKRTTGGRITLVLSNVSSLSSSRTMPRLLGGMACAELETGKGAVCWLRGGSAPCSTVLVECTGGVDEIWLDAAGLVAVVAGGCAPSLACKASCPVEGTSAAPKSRLAQSRGVMWRATQLLILISMSCTHSESVYSSPATVRSKHLKHKLKFESA